MQIMEISFGSDNHSGIHPELLQSIEAINLGHSHSYGLDETSNELNQICKNIFGEKTFVWPVFNGTAANVLCLNQLVRSFECVLVAKQAHINESECAAPEKHIGCKIQAIDTVDGKLTPELMRPYLIRKGDQHFAQIRAVSITQPTEYGTVYSLEEMQSIKAFCKEHELKLHIDGARYIHAATYLNTDLKSLVDASGADALSFGGTKNGLLFGELCVFFDKTTAKDFKFYRKQLLQLPSKQRFISGQFLHFLKNDFWLKLSKHQLQLAKLLEAELQKIDGVEITREVQTNAVFCKLPKSWIKNIRKKHFFYIWDEHTFEIRLLISFDHTREHIQSFVDAVISSKNESVRGPQ